MRFHGYFREAVLVVHGGRFELGIVKQLGHPNIHPDIHFQVLGFYSAGKQQQGNKRGKDFQVHKWLLKKGEMNWAVENSPKTDARLNRAKNMLVKTDYGREGTSFIKIP
jgi:hypothetical protein